MSIQRHVDVYIEKNGWSSYLFFNNALRLFKVCKELDIDVEVGRSVIHLKKKKL